MSRIVEAVSTWQRTRPDALALQGNGSSLSYAELADRVARTADALRERGWVFYTFIGSGHCRFMCSWATKPDDIAALVSDLAQVMATSR